MSSGIFTPVEEEYELQEPRHQTQVSTEKAADDEPSLLNGQGIEVHTGNAEAKISKTNAEIVDIVVSQISSLYYRTLKLNEDEIGVKEINVNESKSSIVFAIQQFGGERPEEAREYSNTHPAL